MMESELLVQQDGPILRITLNRPAAGNSLTDTMAKDFVAALASLDETVEFIVLRGAGADFCTGRGRAPGAPPPSPEAYTRRDEYDVVFDCYAAMRSTPVPVIGVFQGRSMGFGAALAALCDVSFAAESATFNIPEMAHNILPTMVLSALFDRIGRNAITWMAYSREFISAERAMALGFVSTVVPEAALEEQLRKFCENLVNTPRPAIRAVKEYLRVAPSMEPHGAVEYARSLHAMVNTAAAMKRKAH
jgi:enoyl-CoA hydratase